MISTLEQICRLQKRSNDRTWRDVVMADLCTHKRNDTLLIRPATAALLIYSYITAVVFHWVNQIVTGSSLTVTTADHWHQLGDDIWAGSCVLQSQITCIFMWLDQPVVAEGKTSEGHTEVLLANVMEFVCPEKNFMGSWNTLSACLTSSPTWGLLLVWPIWTRDRWPTAMYWHFLFKYTTTVCCAARKNWLLCESLGSGDENKLAPP